MKKFVALLGIVFLVFVSSQSAMAMADKWKNDHNATGVSEMAVEVIKKIVLNDEYDWIVARINPVTTIGGSGCTVESATTSFPAQDHPFYVAGGITLMPTQFRINEVLTYWFSEEPDYGTHGYSGNSDYYRYEWVSCLGSGTTGWKIKVYYQVDDGSGVSNIWTELLATSGQSIYVGADAIHPRYNTDSFTSGNTVTSSTTFYPTFYVGWQSGVTPVINVIGKK